MDNNLLEMLLTLFKKTLTQLKEAYVSETSDEPTAGKTTDFQVTSTEGKKKTLEMVWFQSAAETSTRVFTYPESLKITNASHQLLKRLERLGVFSSDVMELIINRLLFSDSRFVNLQETKWTIRSTLADTLEPHQLAFLDLVLYQKEDGLALH